MPTDLKHITRINDSTTNGRNNLDPNQIMIESSESLGDRYFTYMDSDQNYHTCATQHYYDGSFHYMNAEFEDIYTYGIGYIEEYIRHKDDTDTLIRMQNNNVTIQAGGVIGLDSLSTVVKLVPDASINLEVFSDASSGETPTLQIKGNRTGDSQRSINIGISSSYDDTGIIDNVSSLVFDLDPFLPDTKKLSLGNTPLSPDVTMELNTDSGDEFQIASSVGYNANLSAGDYTLTVGSGECNITASGEITLDSTTSESVVVDSNSITLLEDNNNATEGFLYLEKDRGAAGQDDDGIYAIIFKSKNAAVTPEDIEYGYIRGYASGTFDGSEDGHIKMGVMGEGVADGAKFELVQYTAKASCKSFKAHANIGVDLGTPGSGALTTINGNATIEGNIQVDDAANIGCDSDTDLLGLSSGVLTVNGNIKVDDAANIGCDSDTDLLALASDSLTINGNTTLGGTLKEVIFSYQSVSTSTTYSTDSFDYTVAIIIVSMIAGGNTKYDSQCYLFAKDSAGASLSLMGDASDSALIDTVAWDQTDQEIDVTTGSGFSSPYLEVDIIGIV